MDGESLGVANATLQRFKERELLRLQRLTEKNGIRPLVEAARLRLHKDKKELLKEAGLEEQLSEMRKTRAKPIQAIGPVTALAGGTLVFSSILANALYAAEGATLIAAAGTLFELFAAPTIVARLRRGKASKFLDSLSVGIKEGGIDSRTGLAAIQEVHDYLAENGARRECNASMIKAGNLLLDRLESELGKGAISFSEGSAQIHELRELLTFKEKEALGEKALKLMEICFNAQMRQQPNG